MEDIDMQFPASSDLRRHHIGLVVRAIEESRTFYVDVLQYRERTPIIHDPVQTAFVQFFAIPGLITILTWLRQTANPVNYRKRPAKDCR
jgi:catechol 2,3-dioxygenase-like lactoylglutathione lyase family enzyme